jgi:hypothetical protein
MSGWDVVSVLVAGLVLVGWGCVEFLVARRRVVSLLRSAVTAVRE